MGPSGGLVGALLGGWAKPAARSCGGLAAGSGGNLAPHQPSPSVPAPPSPSMPVARHFGGHGHCSGLAACGCPCSHPASCQPTPAGEPAKQLEAPRPWWARAGGGHGEGGVADSLPRPCQSGPAVALPAPTLPPPQSPLHRRGGHLAPGSGCQEEVLGLLKVKQSPGPEDASSVAAANAMEVIGEGGGELLVGEGPVNGGGVGAGTSSPQGPAGRGGAADSLGPAEELAEEGSPLAPLGPGPMEVDRLSRRQGMVPWWERLQTRRPTPRWPTLACPEWDGCGLAHCLPGGWCPVGGCVGVGGLRRGAKQTD